MGMHSDLDRQGRRDFLKQLVVAGGVFGSGVTLAGVGPAPAARPQTRGSAVQRGYQETEHVREYYTKAAL